MCRLSVSGGGGVRLPPERSDALARQPAGWTEAAHWPAGPQRLRRAPSRSTLTVRDGPARTPCLAGSRPLESEARGSAQQDERARKGGRTCAATIPEHEKAWAARYALVCGREDRTEPRRNHDDTPRHQGPQDEVRKAIFGSLLARADSILFVPMRLTFHWAPLMMRRRCLGSQAQVQLLPDESYPCCSAHLTH